jgi:cytochrome c biogenesis protein CcmG/thiol:disulfide interchange protein DsbE
VRHLRALALAIGLVACSGGGDDPAGLPDLELDPLPPADAPLQLADVTGPAVVNLWATWCRPCREELPAFQAVANARRDVRFIGVNSQEAGEARAFLDELGITYEQYADGDGELAEALGAAALPVTVVIDAEGAIAARLLGPLSVADLERALDDVAG